MEEEKKEEKKGGKGFAIFMILLMLGVLGFAGYYIYDMTYTDNNGEDQIDDDVEELLYKLDVYKQDGSLCLEKTEYCKDIAFSIPTKNETSKVLGFDNEFLFVLYSDGDEVKIYNKNLNESQGTILKDEYKSYKLFVNEDKDNIAGIVYTTNDDKKGYFNLLTGKKLYEGKYETTGEYSYIEIIQINDNYLNVSITNKAYLLSSKEEKEVFSSENDKDLLGALVFSSYGTNGKYIFTLDSCAGDCFTYKIYNNDLKEIYSKNINEQYISSKDNLVYFIEDNKVNKIDMDGNVTEYKTFGDVKGLIEDNVVYVESDKIKIENISTGSVKELGLFEATDYYDYYTSGYYTRYKLDLMGETNKTEGLYVVINYSKQDTNGNYGIEYCLTESGEVKSFPITQEVGGRAKPVLYLYPEETTNVKISFEHPEYLTTTYPKFNKSWEVEAHSNGDLYDKSGKYYYGLYWDEVRYNEVDFREGFYVEDKDAIKFLEEKLDIIGLSDRERNEFIMYWLPILESNKKNLVYFELTNERELGNKLIIEPKPDSILRVSIHIKKVNNKVNIREQKLSKFDRFGFSVIEWGGMTY